MTAIASRPARSRVGAHRVYMIVAFAIIFAAAATFAIVLATSSSGSPTTTSSWPVAPEELSDYEKCIMAHVRVC